MTTIYNSILGICVPKMKSIARIIAEKLELKICEVVKICSFEKMKEFPRVNPWGNEFLLHLKAIIVGNIF